MASVSNVLFPILFADVTNVFLSGNNADELIKIMNIELTKIVDWLDCNKLSLNVSKTHYILFRSQGMRKPLICENLEVRGECIQQDRKTKFLGVIVDEKLTWADHIQYIRTKIAIGLGIICKAKKLLNSQTLCMLYYCNYTIIYILFSLLVCELNRTPNCYGKTWRFLCPFFRNLHLRENLARDCFTSTVSTVTNSVQNIFTHLRYCDK